MKPITRLRRIALATEDNKRHTTDEGWQIFDGLGYNGYNLCGHNLPTNNTNIPRILELLNPDICVVQDPREFDIKARDFRNPDMRFEGINSLKDHHCVKVGMLKDAHQRPEYHSLFADNIGQDATIIYYDEEVVRSYAPYLGKVIRTYHTLDKNLVPLYLPRRNKAIISGAISDAYPLRRRIVNELANLARGVIHLSHPGYHRKGCRTPDYLCMLSNFRISICTSSIYQYALRKMIESTACGCIVVTNLSQKYTLPHIDGNLVRIAADIPTDELRDLINHLHATYNSEKQQHFALLAKEHYDYRVITQQLSRDIDLLYNDLRPQSPS